MNSQPDQKLLFETIYDIDQAEMSGALMMNTATHTYWLYFQSGFTVFVLEAITNSQQANELNRKQALDLLGRIAVESFVFDGAAEPPEHHNWQLRASELILEAARLTTDESRLRGELGDLNQVFEPIFNLEERVRKLFLTQSEVAVLSQLDSPISIRNMIARLGRPETVAAHRY